MLTSTPGARDCRPSRCDVLRNAHASVVGCVLDFVLSFRAMVLRLLPLRVCISVHDLMRGLTIEAFVVKVVQSSLQTDCIPKRQLNNAKMLNLDS